MIHSLVLTAEVAISGRDAVGFEIKAEYLDIACLERSIRELERC